MNPLAQIDRFKSISDLYKLTVEDGERVSLTNVKGGLQGFIALSAYNQAKEHGRDVLLIAPTDEDARRKFTILSRFIDNIAYLPEEGLHLYFSDAFSLAESRDRQKTLATALDTNPLLAVCSMDALLKKLPKPDDFSAGETDLKVGEEFGFDRLISLLDEYGYERTYTTEAVGQFSVRGEIIDVFLSTEENPIRIDFFDDEVDSIQWFDAATQRSIGKINEITLKPLSENWLSEQEHQEALNKLEKLYKNNETFTERFDMVESGHGPAGGVLFSMLNHDTTFMDFLKAGSDGKAPIVIWADPEESKSQAKEYLDVARADYNALSATGEAFKEEFNRYFTLKQIVDRIEACPLVLLHIFEAKDKAGVTIDMDSKIIESFAGQPKAFQEFITTRLNDGYYIHFFARSEEGMEKIKKYLDAVGVDLTEKGSANASKAEFSIGEISEGFELAKDKILFFNESDFFKVPRRRKGKDVPSKRIEQFSDLKLGDYVVHDENGIGKYQGIVPMEVEDNVKDMMKIEYAGGDILYVPVEQMDRVQVYIGTGGADLEPNLNTLGSPAWKKAKSKAKKAAEDMADELIALYAKRSKTPGYAFGPDTSWQKDFEDAFPYEETNDQLQSIEEVKRDMEKPTSMDRLLCGDVGYGKTEVAFRAAFKAIAEGKQVAMLVPTTVLAEQHYISALERFKDFPIRIESLSRFKTPKQQKEIIEDVKNGMVDFLIGTHRLVSKDVDFKDLGLLVIDEEQRFGVKAKEKLKSLKANVDVLTLSATPIPRTLHMSLSGIRDMSVLEEPPEGRRPIQTYVMRYNDAVVKDAIERELARNGQVYYIHNRVEDIDRIARELSALVPQARIVTAHGRMSAKELENVMHSFLNKEYDILVSTTIVESGLDVQNANTMIVEQGDHFGLSQLYQLRGRVGRSQRQAYTYITHDKNALNTIAQQRLKAIRDFTAFGSGFKVAMRDLEIRGAGNILGAQQSGHMSNIGYELYTRILEQAITERMTGQKAEEEQEIKIRFNISAFIPQSYIIGDKIKYEIYRKLAKLSNWEEYHDLEDELLDRFGKIPKPIYNLMLIAMIKNNALAIGIEELNNYRGRLIIRFSGRNTAQKALNALMKHKAFLKFINFNEGSKEKPAWSLRLSSGDNQFLRDVFKFVRVIKDEEDKLKKERKS